MITKELSEAAVEFNYILDNSSQEIRNKISPKFIKYMRDIASTTYIFNYDNSKKLNEQKLKAETRGLIALVYQDYICTEEEKKDYIIKCKNYKFEKEKKLREKYNPDDILKNKREIKNEEQTEEKSLTVVQEEKWYQKIFNLIKGLFRKK